MPINHPIMDGNIIHHPLKMAAVLSKRHPAPPENLAMNKPSPTSDTDSATRCRNSKMKPQERTKKNHPPLGKSMGITIPMGLNYNGLGSLWDEKFKKQQLQKLLIMQWLDLNDDCGATLRWDSPSTASQNHGTDQTATVSFGACWHSFRFNMLRWTDKQYLFERWQPRAMRTTWRPSMPY